MIKPTFEGILGGFDGKATPKWQMVGKGDIAVVFLNDGDGTEVKVIQTGIIELEEATNDSARRILNGKPVTNSIPKNLRIFRIKGLMSGNTFIEVRREKQLVERLEVLVTETIQFKVSFKYVSDTAGHSTKRDKSTLNDLIAMANIELLNNVNIKIINHNSAGQNLKFDRNLGNVVMYQNVGDIIASKRDKTATFTVFFVWEYEQDDTPKIDNAEAAAINRIIFFEDEQGYNHSETLIHEIGHLLGMPHFDKSDYIMNSLGESGHLFTKNQIVKMRDILRHILKLAR